MFKPAQLIVILVAGVVVAPPVIAQDSGGSRRAAAATAAAADEKLTAYENNEYHFRLSYPAKLQPMEPPSKLAIFFLGTQADGPNDIFRESVTIKRETAKPLPNLTFDQALKGFLGSMTKAGMKVIESNPSKLGGIQAQRIVYAHHLKLPKGEVDVKAVMFFVYKDDQPYSLDVRATEKTFDDFLPIAQKVIDSFQWSDLKDQKKE